jgi:mannose-6-phosphate isomerase-like protein (cupin superfamily)
MRASGAGAGARPTLEERECVPPNRYSGGMELYKISSLRSLSQEYKEFVRTPDISAGVYRLAAGATDQQTPHTEDEIYYVVSGHGRFGAAGRDTEVVPGDVLFVPKMEAHQFHDIDEDLVLLVVFGPAGGTRASQSA